MSPELTSLQEAYNRVYSDSITVDEAVYGGEKPEVKDTRKVVTNADKKGNTKAYQNYKAGHKDYKAAPHLGEATAMAKRGLNEPAIRTQIAKSTGGGESADRATKLADKQSFGQGDSKARENLARKQRGDFRKTTSSSPGLQGYAHKATNDADKAKQSARGAQRGVLTPDEKKKLNREEFDIYDIVLEYLLDEGYAESVKEAESIMVNMSDDWREDIVEEVLDEALTGERYKKAVKKPGGTAYSRMVSPDPAKRATRGGRGGESDFGAGDRGSGNKAARRAGTYKDKED